MAGLRGFLYGRAVFPDIYAFGRAPERTRTGTGAQSPPVLAGISPRDPDFVYLHACLDGPDSRRTEIQSDIIRNRRPLHLIKGIGY